jgi:hypothetical protein
LEKEGYAIDPQKWSISNSMTMTFIYLPGNPKSPGLMINVQKRHRNQYFYKIATAPSNAIKGIYTLNVQIVFQE